MIHYSFISTHRRGSIFAAAATITRTISRTQFDAANAHKLFCRSLLKRFPDYDDQTWGISASDSSLGA